MGEGMEQLQGLLQPIMELLSEQDQQLLVLIIQQLMQGQPLTAEQVAWLEALPPELQQMIAEALSQLGLTAEMAPMAGAVAGPPGMV